MKGWIIEEPKKLVEQEIIEPDFLATSPKTKITKALVTLADLLRYDGEVDCDKIVLGTNGIGIITEAEPNLFDLEKGKHVYIESDRECGECSNCVDGEPSKCTNVRVAGEDYDGFLRDFMSALPEKIFVLPENVSDFEALFINQISRSIEIIDKLHIKKGDYVVVIGGNNFGMILSQLLIYYSAVPILITNDDKSIEDAKNSGIYYVLGSDDNWQKEVYSITSGRLCEKVVFISDCGIPTTKALSLACYGADVAFTGSSVKSNSISINQAVKKQLNIKCINNGFNNTASSINLLSNKAINLDHLKIETVKYTDVPQAFERLSKAFEKGEFIPELVVEML